MSAVAATVGSHVITVADVDAREGAVRAGVRGDALPRPGAGEARQLRRWLTQVLVAEQVVAMWQGPVDLDAAPFADDLLPDAVARMEVGSVAAATLADPRGRAVFAAVTADVRVPEAAVADYHERNPLRFSSSRHEVGGWRRAPGPARLDEVRAEISAHLLAAARRREYRRWLDARCAELVTLAPGYEHPGDPRQPDNTHRH